MKTIRFLLAAIALAAVAAPASAQVAIEARLGKSIRVGVVAPAPARGHDHGHHRHDHRGHDHRGHGRHDRDDDRRGHRHGHRSSGYWRTVYDEVTIPGYWREERLPPRYGWVVDGCGHRSWVMIDAGGCRRVWVPARCEQRPRRVWVSC